MHQKASKRFILAQKQQIFWGRGKDSSLGGERDPFPNFNPQVLSLGYIDILVTPVLFLSFA